MLRQTLQELPEGLDETYVLILTNIDTKHVEYAVTILRWLVFAARPLLVSEVLKLTGFQLNEHPTFDRDGVLMEQADIERICSSLVSVYSAESRLSGDTEEERSLFFRSTNADVTFASNQTSNGVDKTVLRAYVRLAHFSVQEFLLSDRIPPGRASRFELTSLESHELIARSCIEYLLHLGEFGNVNQELFDRFPLAKYAAHRWTTHVRDIEDEVDEEEEESLSGELTVLIDQLSLESCPAFKWWVEICKGPRLRFRREYSLARYPDPTPLHMACLEGLITAVSSILKRSVDNVQCIWDGYGTPLMVAAQSDFWHQDVIHTLLNHGADINYGGIDDDIEFGSPLGVACACGDEKLMQVLLDRGAALNGVNGIDRPISPLVAAAARGQRDIVKKLLARKAAVESRGALDETPLMAAVASHVPGAIDLARLLLNNGACVDTESIIVGTAIQQAAFAENWECVKMLIEEYGANINAEGGNNDLGTALNQACERDNEEMIRYLLEKGAVDTDNKCLRAACRSGKENMVRILLERCSDVNAASTPLYGYGKCRTALGEAALHGTLSIVETLLKAGAFDAHDETFEEIRAAYRHERPFGATAGGRARINHLMQVYKALQVAKARKQ